jgi:hypothetical protein
MTPDLQNFESQPKPDPTITLVSLDAIEKDAVEALRTFGISAVLGIALRAVAAAGADESTGLITHQAKDLLHSAAILPSPCQYGPPGTHLVQITLDFQLVGSPGHHLVEIRPPSTVKVAHPADSSIIHAWLIKSPLHVIKVRTVLILILAFTVTAAPAFDDNDDDDGDDDPTKITLQQR